MHSRIDFKNYLFSGCSDCDRCFFIVSSSFPGFFLNIMEESYNMNPPLIFYPNKSGFRSMCCLFSLFFFWLGHKGWAIAPWIRVCRSVA